jgi:hypothetical protein
MDLAIADRCTAWVRQTYVAMKPFAGPGRYVNYLNDDETGDSVPAAYGPNYQCLRKVKMKYDPSNFFPLLGYQFSPRLADIGGSRFWRVDQKAD